MVKSFTTEAWQNYRKELLRFVLNRVPDKEMAEDIVQNVLLKAYVHQRELKSTSKLRAWLYQITRNALVDFDGLPQNEIAAKTSLSLSGAKSRVQRGRKMLRAAFFGCCQFELDRRGGVIDYQPRLPDTRWAVGWGL